jgi:hypothetical protein
LLGPHLALGGDGIVKQIRSRSGGGGAAICWWGLIHSGSKNLTKGLLIIAPGLTIRDRLRVLQPNDPDSYYKSREIVPDDMLADLGKAKIVITNYHAFKRHAEVPLNKVQQAALQTEEKPFVDRDLLRNTVTTDGLSQEAQCPLYDLVLQSAGSPP